jgi:hypothetical protein
MKDALPYISMAMTLIGFIYLVTRNKKSDDKETQKCISDLQERVVRIETKIDVFWKGVGFSASQVLHSPHTPELDRLIEKFQCDQIDDVELREFKMRLREIVESDEDKLKQKAARDVLTLIKVRYEIAPEIG